MKPERKKPRATRGTLHIIAMMLLASGVVRVGYGAGQALANEDEAPTETNHGNVTTGLPNSLDTEKTASLLEAFRAREARLVAAEEQYEARLSALREAEAAIDEKLAALSAAEAALSATMSLAEAASETDLGKLATVYENMKPKDAAALFAEMTPEFAAGFLGLMRPEAAAAIMTQLDPTIAYTFSVFLAGRNAGVPRN